jgi:hypothetical protein
MDDILRSYWEEGFERPIKAPTRLAPAKHFGLRHRYADWLCGRAQGQPQADPLSEPGAKRNEGAGVILYVAERPCTRCVEKQPQPPKKRQKEKL